MTQLRFAIEIAKRTPEQAAKWIKEQYPDIQDFAIRAILRMHGRI